MPQRKRWSKVRRAAFDARRARREAAANKEPVDLVGGENTLQQTPSVDVGRMQERARRQGFVDAMSLMLDALIREIR